MPILLATASDPNAATFTFATTTIYFRLLMAAPEQSREAQITVRHIPGGNVNVVSFGGQMPTYIRGQALFASYADFVAMKDSGVATAPNPVAGTLTYAEATYPVFLTKISRSRVPSNNGYMIAAVEFLVSL